MNASSGLFTLLLAVGFVVYFYLPHVLFRLGAGVSIDLERHKQASQVEEFLFAALPSAILNGLACAFIFLPRFGIRFLVKLPLLWVWDKLPTGFTDFWHQVERWTPGAIDWKAIGLALASPSQPAAVSAATIAKSVCCTVLENAATKVASSPPGQLDGLSGLVGRGRWWGELAYLCWLATVALLNGYFYGRVVLARINLAVRADRIEREVENKKQGMSRWRRISWSVKWYAGGLAYKLWNRFYKDMHVSLYPWVVRKQCVWVRTLDKRLFWGRLMHLDYDADGSIAGFELDEVKKYKRKKSRLSSFVGPVYIPWRQVAEINFTTPSSLAMVKERLKRTAGLA